MSAVAIPPTKPCGARPPILPPIVTGFDGGVSPEGEPFERFLISDVRRLLSDCRSASRRAEWGDGLFLRLLRQRKRAVQRELDFHRMLAPELLPPSVMSGFEEASDEDEIVQSYVRLLSELDQVYEELKGEISAQNTPPAASDY